MFKLFSRGDFKRTEKFLKKSMGEDYMSVLKEYAEWGLNALIAATPVDSGKTCLSWSYEIKRENGGIHIIWSNSNVNDGVNIAVILQYGHGTGWGGYVQGRDYINPALRPVFDAIADKAWKEVTSV